jgi:hypothetical protein
MAYGMAGSVDKVEGAVTEVIKGIEFANRERSVSLASDLTEVSSSARH